MEKILILGGDGYLGWPAAVYFSEKGYDVTIVDNYAKRNSFERLDISPLYNPPNLIQRAKLWEKYSTKVINVIIADLSAIFRRDKSLEASPNAQTSKLPSNPLFRPHSINS